MVVAYPAPVRTLLAARVMASGVCLPHEEMAALNERFEVPPVRNYGSVTDAKRFVDEARSAAGIEGYVVCFADGHRLKLKSDGYVLRHRALSSVHLEKNVLSWVATGAVDDVVAILPSEIGERLIAYQATINAALAAHAGRVRDFATAHRGFARKVLAALMRERFDAQLQPALFFAYDGKDPEIALRTLITRAAGSDNRVEAVRDLFGMTWSAEGLALPESEA